MFQLNLFKLKNNLSLFVLILLFSFTSENKLNSSANKKLKVLGLFSHPGKSHFDVFKPILEELAVRGHELTVISYFPLNNRTKLSNYRDISLVRSGQEILLNVVNLARIKHNFMTSINELFHLRNWAIKSCTDGLFLPEVQEFIKSNQNFDLIMTEAFNSDCFLAFVDKFNAPVVALSSHVLMPWASYRIGNSDNPSSIPSIFSGLSENMNFFQRLSNSIFYPYSLLFYEIAYNWPMQSIVDQAFGQKISPLGDIYRKTSAVLVNTHYSLHGSKPLLPNIIEVGGIHLNNRRNSSSSLPVDIKKFLDDAKEGVVYFSWGSMIRASSMPQDKLKIILRAIESIPFKVIWKWEDENLPNKPNNVLIRKWLPQSAILEHPNVKCYLAHGGLLGTIEGVSAGVPMVIVPMYGDQFTNAAAAQNRKVAIVLQWERLSTENLAAAINKTIYDPSYQSNAKLLKSAWHDRPESPLEKAIWWCEYIARGNGNKFLKNSASTLSWYQRILIDVLLFITGTLFFIYWTVSKCFGIIKSIFKRSDTATRKKQQ